MQAPTARPLRAPTQAEIAARVQQIQHLAQLGPRAALAEARADLAALRRWAPHEMLAEATR